MPNFSPSGDMFAAILDAVAAHERAVVAELDNDPCCKGCGESSCLICGLTYVPADAK